MFGGIFLCSGLFVNTALIFFFSPVLKFLFFFCLTI